MRNFILALIYIVLFTGQVCAQTSSAALEAYGRGDRLAQAGNLPAAIKEFQKAVSLAPGNQGMRTHLAWLLLNRGQLREAAVHFRVLLDQQPDLKEALSGLALALNRLGELDRGLTCINRGLHFYPRDFQLLSLKADILAARPQTAALAVPVYEELVKLQPENRQWARQRQELAQKIAAASYSHALAALKNKDYPKALQAMTIVLKYAPESLDYRTHYGWMLLEAGESSGAAREFREVLEKEPQNYEALRGLAWTQLAQQDYNGAMASASSGLASYPGDDKFLEILADAAARPGTKEIAAQTYPQVLARRPGDLPLQVKYAKFLMLNWQLDEAEQEFYKILAADPVNLDAKLGLAKINLLARDYGSARAGYGAVLAAAPNNQEARQGLEAADQFMRPQIQTFGGYLEDSETFRRSFVYSSCRYYLTDHLLLNVGYGYLVYDKGVGYYPPFQEQKIHRHVLPVLLQYRPWRQLILEAAVAFSNYGSFANSAVVRASAYYQMTTNRGIYLYYSYYDVIDPGGPFNGPWGRHLDNFPDFNNYRYWISDPIATWAQNIYGSSSTLAIVQHIRGNEAGAWIYQDLFSRLTLSAWGAVAPYTDGNVKKAVNLAAYYRLVTEPFLLKLKTSFYYLGYRNRSAVFQGLPPGSVQLYFDPIAFKNYSWGIIFEKNFSPRLKLVLESDLQLTPGASQPGVLGLAELDVLLTKNLSLRVIGFYNNSINNDNTSYQVRSVTVGLTYRF